MQCKLWGNFRLHCFSFYGRFQKAQNLFVKRAPTAIRREPFQGYPGYTDRRDGHTMLTHKGTQTLHTERLTLRRFTPDDAQAMFDNWAKDGRVTRYLTWSPHPSPEATQELLRLWCDAYENPGTYNWAMVYEGTLIGNISVTHMDEKSEWAELGYCMGYAYWNKGLMPEAVKAVIAFLFTQVLVNRIAITHAVKNPASGRVAQKCGFTFEGTKREYYQSSTGEFLDISDYGILRREWEARENP